MEKSILIKSDETDLTSCVSVIVVPEIALKEAGYIKMFTQLKILHYRSYITDPHFSVAFLKNKRL